MKRFVPFLFAVVVALGTSIAAAAACADLVVKADGQECTLIRESQSGNCYYDCK